MSETLTGKDKADNVDELSILRSFYRLQGVPEDRLSEIQQHRFIRLNPRFDRAATLELLRSECLDHGSSEGKSSQSTGYPILVPWLHASWGFYALPGDFRLAQSPCFRQGRVYGQDVSSGAAVAALMTSDHDTVVASEKTEYLLEQPYRVLDLCCAPGLKLCAIADWLQANDTVSEIVGVDLSETRINVCSRVIRKYQTDPETSKQQQFAADDVMATSDNKSCVRIQVYCNDGTTFLDEDDASNLIFDSSVAQEEASHCGKRKRMNKSARARHARQINSIRQQQMKANDGKELRLFHRVLVDAECSTDGSIKHMQKRLRQASGEELGSHIATLVDSSKMDVLVDLQKRLAANGFRLLLPGGSMVYSTCSLSEQQNEGVVRWLLATFPNAELVPISFSTPCSSNIQVGTLDGTVRVLPGSVVCNDVQTAYAASAETATLGCGGGFFLAKLTKRIIKKLTHYR